MRYRKFQANHLFNGRTLLAKNNVLIIGEEGNVVDIVDVKDAGDEIEFYNGIISPAFVNAHCHLELSHLKNRIPQKTGLVDFVFKVVTERHFAEEEILNAIKDAEQEMAQNGIIAVGDICNNLFTLFQKRQRNLHYYNFVETSGWLPEIASSRFEKNYSIYKHFINNGLPASITPHAPYSVSKNLWEKMIPLFEGKTLSIHNQETPDEDLFFLTGEGAFTEMYEMMNIDNSFYKPQNTRSVESYFKNFSSAASVILVHNTFTKQEDLDFIKRNKNEEQIISFCLCPNANLYIENALPPVNLLMKNNCRLVLGTDSLASNHQLNILEEIKTINKNFPGIKTETLLTWATINGAEALQMDNTIGTFEKDKKPGVVLIGQIEDGNITDHSTIQSLMR